MSVKSPCVRKCGLNENNICVGCGRTTRDIRIWGNCNEKERIEIVKESSKRLSRLQEVRDDGFLSDT